MTYYAVILGRLAGCRKIVFAVQDWDVWKRSGAVQSAGPRLLVLAARVVADGEGARRLAARGRGWTPRRLMTIYDGINPRN